MSKLAVNNVFLLYQFPKREVEFENSMTFFTGNDHVYGILEIKQPFEHTALKIYQMFLNFNQST